MCERRDLRLSFISAAFVLLAAPPAAFNVMVPYSGQLAEDGAAVSGDRTVQAQIVRDDGTVLYDSGAITITIDQGAFSLLLGDTTQSLPALDSSLFAETGLLLRFFVDSDGDGIGANDQLSPDVPLPTAPYAAGGDHSALQNLGADDHTQYLDRSGLRPMTGNLNLGGNSLGNANTLNAGGLNAIGVNSFDVSTTTMTATGLVRAQGGATLSQPAKVAEGNLDFSQADANRTHVEGKGPRQFSGTGWVGDPTAAQAVDDEFIEKQIPFGSSESVTLFDYGFAVPDEATVTGIKVEFYRTTNEGGTTDSAVELTLPGSETRMGGIWGFRFAQTISRYGGEGDLWGLGSVTPAQVNDPGFGVSAAPGNIVNANHAARVDAGLITVFFTTPGPTDFALGPPDATTGRFDLSEAGSGGLSYITVTVDGRIGICNPAPQAKVDIKGDVKVDGKVDMDGNSIENAEKVTANDVKGNTVQADGEAIAPVFVYAVPDSAEDCETISAVAAVASGAGWAGAASDAATNDGLNKLSATVPAGGTSTPISFTNFGFNIPANATIVRVTVDHVLCAVGPTVMGRESVTLLLPSPLVKVQGPWGDLFGGACDGKFPTVFSGDPVATPAEVNDPSFGVELIARSFDAGPRVAEIDYLRVTITYCLDEFPRFEERVPESGNQYKITAEDDPTRTYLGVTRERGVSVGTDEHDSALHVADEKLPHITVEEKASGDKVSIGIDPNNENQFRLAYNAALLAPFLTATSENLVGINTPMPEEKLHVTGNTRIDGDLEVSGALVTGSTSPGGDLDMQNNVITNIGDAGTDFSASGGLTLANALTVTFGGVSVADGGLTVSGDASISGALRFIGTDDRFDNPNAGVWRYRPSGGGTSDLNHVFNSPTGWETLSGAASAGDGLSYTIRGGAGGAGDGRGGDGVVKGGDGGATDGDGGDVMLMPGQGAGTGSDGIVRVASTRVVLNDEAAGPEDTFLEVEIGAAARPAIGFDGTAGVWRFSNDGTTFNDIPTSGGGGGGDADTLDGFDSATDKTAAQVIYVSRSDGMLPSDTVDSGSISDNTITADDIANNTITADEITNNTITADEIADNTITGDQILDASVDVADIAPFVLGTLRNPNDTSVVAVEVDSSARVGIGTTPTEFFDVNGNSLFRGQARVEFTNATAPGLIIKNTDALGTTNFLSVRDSTDFELMAVRSSGDVFAPGGFTGSGFALDNVRNPGTYAGRVRGLSGAGGTQFGAVNGIADASSTESDITILTPNAAMRASDFAVRLKTAPGAGNGWSIALRINGGNTAISTSITGTGTTAIDTSTVVIPPLSELSFSFSPTGTPADTDALFAFGSRNQ